MAVSDVVPYESPLPDAAGAVVRWAQAADAAYQLAQKLCVSTFVPEAFRNRPAEAAVAIIAGAEVDLPPLKALNGFDVIGGTAAPRALTLRAIALSRGHDIVVETASPDRVVMRGRRRGSEEWQRVEWTIKRAAQLGLTTRARDASKNPWLKQPQNMLVARATAELVRLVAADAVLGIAYSAEELADEAPAATTVARSTTRTTVRRALPTPPEPEVPLGELTVPQPEPAEPTVEVAEPPLEDEEPADEAMVTKPQLAKIAAGLRDLSITERAPALEYVARAIGHAITSRSELTREEAHQVIETLDFDLRDEPDEPETEDEP